MGRDVVFNEGRYAPGTSEGKRLLAHELAHVIQQERGGAAPQLNPAAAHEQDADADRKSTRLNSSHGYISYAVFCLKKKKTSIKAAPSLPGASATASPTTSMPRRAPPCWSCSRPPVTRAGSPSPSTRT